MSAEARREMRRDTWAFVAFVVAAIALWLTPSHMPWNALRFLAYAVYLPICAYYSALIAQDLWSWAWKASLAQLAGGVLRLGAVAAPIVWIDIHHWWWPTAVAVMAAVIVAVTVMEVLVGFALAVWREHRTGVES